MPNIRPREIRERHLGPLRTETPAQHAWATSWIACYAIRYYAASHPCLVTPRLCLEVRWSDGSDDDRLACLVWLANAYSGDYEREPWTVVPWA